MKEQELIEIYREAFPEPDFEFEERLFKYCGEYCRTIEIDGKTAAMLFALPCEIYSGAVKEDGYYIYAAATAVKYRGLGFMSRLIETVKAEGKPLFLVPADEKLVGFYKRQGFCEFTVTEKPNNTCKALPTGGFERLAETEREENGKTYNAMYYGKMPLDNMYFPFVME